MKDMTLGTFIACMACAFMVGFIACHKLYSGMENRHDFTHIRRDYSSPNSK